MKRYTPAGLEEARVSAVCYCLADSNDDRSIWLRRLTILNRDIQSDNERGVTAGRAHPLSPSQKPLAAPSGVLADTTEAPADQEAPAD